MSWTDCCNCRREFCIQNHQKCNDIEEPEIDPDALLRDCDTCDWMHNMKCFNLGKDGCGVDYELWVDDLSEEELDFLKGIKRPTSSGESEE